MPEDSGNTKKIIALAVVASPWTVFGLTWVMAPGYISPFIHHPIGLSITLLSLAISGISYWLLQRFSHVAVWICVILFLVLPIFSIPTLGPAIITIMQALGPAVGGSSH